jgi:CRP/FNR family transcriptional regulator
MPGKLAQTLLYLNQEHFAEKDLFSLLTRNDLADFAAISSINVVKLLHQFEDEGIIKLNGRKITVTDKEALHSIAKNG